MKHGSAAARQSGRGGAASVPALSTAMASPPRAVFLAACVLALGAGLSAQQASPGSTPPEPTPEQMERFLLEGRLVSTRYASGGVTNSLRVTLTDGALTHDAHVQSIDEYWDEFRTTRGTEFAFRDSYRYNIAAYRLARLLGLQNVPVSVERMLRGKTSAVTWWIDDVLMDEKDRLKTRDTGPSSSRFAMQVYIQRVFDELIANTDRNLGNMIWTRDWTMWLIDHTRAFRLQKQLSKPERLTRCDRALLAAIRRLAPDVVKQAVGSSLRDQEIDALVARAGLLVVHFDRLAAERGEARVFFTLTRRRGEAGPAGS